MAAPFVPDEGKLRELLVMRNNSITGSQMRLFTNDVTADHTVEAADLTEAAWSGYAAVTLDAWGDPFLTADFHAKMIHDVVSFTNTSGTDQDFWGWAIVELGGGKIILIQKYDSVRTIADGETINFLPFYTDQTE